MLPALFFLIALSVVALLAAVSWRRNRCLPKAWLLVLPVLTVTVHYNPQNPGQSLLYAREDWASYVRLSLGAFLGLGGLMLFGWHLRR
jgi:hypothetical protein